MDSIYIPSYQWSYLMHQWCAFSRSVILAQSIASRSHVDGECKWLWGSHIKLTPVQETQITNMKADDSGHGQAPVLSLN